MTDKIADELEKEIARITKLNDKSIEDYGNDEPTPYEDKLLEAKAKLAQHIATKQAMIKEFDEMLLSGMYTLEEINILMIVKQKLGELK